jgi:hypothetical protein
MDTDINHYYISSNGNLSDEGRSLFHGVKDIVGKRNWNNSDSSVDYFDVNFYEHYSIGKWDKPFVLKTS